MDDAEKRELRIAATMDGIGLVLKKAGKMVSVSEIELFCLVNSAYLDILNYLAAFDESLGETSEETLALREQRKLCSKFFSKTCVDGLLSLRTSTSAIVLGRLKKYIVGFRDAP
jgi:hypothetical protein